MRAWRWVCYSVLMSMTSIILVFRVEWLRQVQAWAWATLLIREIQFVSQLRLGLQMLPCIQLRTNTALLQLTRLNMHVNLEHQSESCCTSNDHDHEPRQSTIISRRNRRAHTIKSWKNTVSAILYCAWKKNTMMFHQNSAAKWWKKSVASGR